VQSQVSLLEGLENAIQQCRTKMQAPPSVQLYLELKMRLAELQRSAGGMRRRVDTLQKRKQQALSDIQALCESLSRWKQTLPVFPEPKEFDSGMYFMLICAFPCVSRHAPQDITSAALSTPCSH
jgi:hypothetical protein